MNTKVKKTYIYEGLGFPIELHNVEINQIRGEFIPKINIEAIADDAIKDLIWQKTKLSGNQIKFVRNYFSHSLRQFANIVNESHVAVKKWETFKNKPTTMDPNIEKTIRVYIYEKVCIKNIVDERKFYDKYRVIKDIISKQKNSQRNNPELTSVSL
jgi:DNA-binding transcriptional regulator YiaG